VQVWVQVSSAFSLQVQVWVLEFSVSLLQVQLWVPESSASSPQALGWADIRQCCMFHKSAGTADTSPPNIHTNKS
jgi:hypothetical protein